MGRVYVIPSNMRDGEKRIFATVLSMRAKGCYAQLRAMEGLDITVKDLETCFSEQKYSLKKAIDELVESGYLVRATNKGNIPRSGQTNWYLFDTPVTEDTDLKSIISSQGKDIDRYHRALG